MKLLLDTHAFIWWDSQPDALSARVLALCQDRSNTLLLSVVSLWEILVKMQLGKLRMSTSLRDVIGSQVRLNQLEILPFTFDHVWALENLPAYHKDPFDRLLIAQAIVEEAMLVTNDAMIAKYPVNIVW